MMNTEKQLRIGVIGIGNMGSAHAASLYNGKVNGCLLAALCDINAEKRRYAKEHYPNVSILSSSDELIKSNTVDAVIVATPHRFHTDIAVSAMRAGIDVLSEKPADVIYSKAQEAVKVAKEEKRVYALMFNQRNNPVYTKLNELIKSGSIGRIKRVDWTVTNWYRTQKYYDSGDWRGSWSGEGGGVLINQAPHNLDMINMLFGLPNSVYARCSIGKYHNISVEDEAMLILSYNDFDLTFRTATGECPGTNRMEIACDMGKVIVENGKITCALLDESERSLCFDSNESFPSFSVKVTDLVSEGADSAHIGIINNFRDAILYGAPLTASGTDGVNEIMLSNAAYLSAYTKETVELPLSDPKKIEDLLLKLSINEKRVCKDNPTQSLRNDYSERWSVRW